MNKNIVIIGASGHGKVIADIVMKSEDNLVGFLDDNMQIQNKKIFEDKKVIGIVSDCEKLQKNNSDYLFIVGIGNNYIRKEIFERYKLNYYTAIHPNAILSNQIQIGKGTVVMANAVINTNANIGENCIINTGAIVEHDNIVSSNVHISPNATLCGTVKICELTHIGASATVKNNITICDECIIGAGAVVVKNIEEKGTYVGVPVKKINEV